jgi:exopolysaccharide biosynthesis polyprenyl glycosylphosphotransferase
MAETCTTQIHVAHSPNLRAVSRELISSNWGRLSFLVCWDLLAVALAVGAGYFVSPRYNFDATGHISLPAAAVFLALAFMISALSFGLYERPNGDRVPTLLLRSGFSAVSAWAIVLLFDYALTFVPIGRWIVVISGVVLICATSSGRLILRYFQEKMPMNLIVLGDDRVCRSIQLAGQRRSCTPLKIHTVALTVGDLVWSLPSDGSPDWQEEGHDEVTWIVIHGSCDEDTLKQLRPFLLNGTRICDVSTFFEHFYQKVPVEFIDFNWFIRANVSLVAVGTRALKRAADILGALVGLILTLPLWPAIALAIKLSSKGPVFYFQERVGRHGQVFSIFKFRTMNVEAESSGKASWATRGDARVTSIGRFLRRTRLDEVPQFLNVLLGKMSLVGPRPERPEFVDLLNRKVPHYEMRHLVRPGITGWAQISYRYASSIDDSVEKLKYDLYYVKYGGLFLDLQIMVRTLGVIMRGSR